MQNSTPTAAAISRPILVLLIVSFVLNAGSGVGLWLWSNQNWRIFHGCSIPLFLITLGVIWRVHILRGWRLKKNIFSGILTLSVFLFLIITGWIIYYCVPEEPREKAAQLHTWVGIGSSFLLLAHTILGLKSRVVEDKSNI